MLICLVSLALFSCGDKEATVYYFDFHQYFNAEVADLQGSMPKIKKTIVLNGVSEEKTISTDSGIWVSELKPFLAMDINKPAWKDAYSVDTIRANEGYEIVFTGDSSMAIPFVNIGFDDNGSVRSIKFSKFTRNSFGSIRMDMEYRTKSGYSVKKVRDLNKISHTEFEINARYIY